MATLEILKNNAPNDSEKSLESEFRSLADQWQKDTRKMSSIEQIVLHPAYQQIIGMGKPILPLVLAELKRTRGHWLWALAMITRSDKAKPGELLKEAIDEWLRWGEKMGYV